MSKIAQGAADWANSLSKDDLQKEYAKYSGEFASEKKERPRRPPNPRWSSKAQSKGTSTPGTPGAERIRDHRHAKAALLASAFAQIYEGKLSLYFDDSNPEKEKQEYVDAIKGRPEMARAPL